LPKESATHQLHFPLAASWIPASAAAPAQECEMAPLPAICTKLAKASIGAMKKGLTWHVGHANRASAQGARIGWKMWADIMSVTGQAPEVDVAFQFEPHYQGTISLARVQLNYARRRRTSNSRNRSSTIQENKLQRMWGGSKALEIGYAFATPG